MSVAELLVCGGQRSLRRICFSFLMAAASLTQSQNALPRRLPLKDQIAQHERKLADARARKPAPALRDEAIELNLLGGLYRQQGKSQKALDCLNEALGIERNAHSRGGEALTLNMMGRVYTDLGQEQKALDLFNQILPVWRELGNREGEAATLTNMGRAYSDLAQEEKALDYLNQALPIWRQTGGRNGEASALDNIGKAYMDMSQSVESLKYLKQALPIWQEMGERGGEALTLNNMGRAYSDLGQKKESIACYKQALSIWREIGNRQGEASTLNNLGRVYSDLGQKQTALDDLNQALPIWHEVGNRNGEALILNDIGRVHFDLHEAEKAEDFYDQALPIWREVGNRRGEATTLINVGRAQFDEGNVDKSLQTDYESLPIWREVREGRGEALALSSISKIYAAHGQSQKALVASMAALSLVKAAGDPDLEGGIETQLMVGFRNHDQPEVAILFGYEAVNSYQRIRKNLSGLEKDLQAGFAQSKSSTYRMLAELLVQQNRLGEAEQVLDLLKEQELRDILHDGQAGGVAQIPPLKVTPAQQKFESELDVPEKKAQELEDFILQNALLQAQAPGTADQKERSRKINTSIEQGSTEFTQFLNAFAKTIGAELKASVDSTNQGGTGLASDSTQSFLQGTLAKLGPRAMGIRILIGDNHVYAIVVRAGTRKKFELKASPAELRSKAFEVRDVLASRASDPRLLLSQLYAMVVAPIEGELKTLDVPAQSETPTLLWSLDDALRYVPMASLYDGHRYLVERFKNVLFTPESYGHMSDAPLLDQSGPTVLAMGLSKSYGGLPALPGVMPELEAVVHDPAVPESHGPMEGRLLPNDEFTLAALTTELGEGKRFSVVHIASHFVEETGNGAEPFLMMGGENSGDENGYAWSLSAMEGSPVAFHGTQLLTLSACSTGKDYKSRDGVEMDSLGMVAQQKGAEAVLATLWDVNDASTSRIMSDFYSRWLTRPGEGKAEALRQAQIAFLRGAAKPVAGETGRGVEAIEDTPAAPRDASYANPYYWAPFVLIGNYR